MVVPAYLLAYLLAKVLEQYDGEVFALTGWISGHTLKHLVAGIGAWWVVRSALPQPARKRPAADEPNGRQLSAG